MRIVFFGSSQFAVPCLKAITEAHHQILAVATATDKKAGRGLKLCRTKIKDLCLEKNFYILQPQNPNKDKAFVNTLRELKADAFVVVSYGCILSEDILGIPHFFAINLHPSLLPKYRGAAPINWAIINGEQKTGISVIKMTKKIDAGPIIYQQEDEISREDTIFSLGERLSQEGALAVVKTLSLMESGKITFKAQEEEKVSFAPRLKKEDARIDFNLPALNLHNRIRGMLNWPVAFTFFKNKRIELLISDYEEKKTNCPASQIIEIAGEHIKISTGDGILIVKKVKPEGKREMPVCDFARGHGMREGDNFS